MTVNAFIDKKIVKQYLDELQSKTQYQEYKIIQNIFKSGYIGGQKWLYGLKYVGYLISMSRQLHLHHQPLGESI